MRKFKFILSFVIAIIFINNLSVFGQKNQFYFSIGNNGQISDDINTFYPTVPTFQRKIITSSIQYLLRYDFFVKSNFILGAKIGYATNNNTATSTVSLNNNVKITQKFYNLSLYGKYVWQTEKFQLSSGIEIPYFIIDKYHSNFYMGNGNQITQQTMTIDGGKAYGFNSVSSIKFFLSKVFFISTDASFGFIIFDFGGNNENITFISNSTGSSTDNFTYKNTYHKVTFSKPELSFGFGIKL